MKGPVTSCPPRRCVGSDADDAAVGTCERHALAGYDKLRAVFRAIGHPRMMLAHGPWCERSLQRSLRRSDSGSTRLPRRRRRRVVQTSSEQEVAEAEVPLPDAVDLHARPAANLVRAAMRFSSAVSVATDAKEADAKSLLSVLALGARRGTSIRIRATGEDATEAIAALTALVAELHE